MTAFLVKHEDKWSPEPNTGCYIWTGAYDVCNGYKRPKVKIKGEKHYAARIVCEETYGPMLKGVQAAHKPPCTNTLCISPEHLYPATQSQNEFDKPLGTRLRASRAATAALYGRVQ